MHRNPLSHTHSNTYTHNRSLFLSFLSLTHIHTHTHTALLGIENNEDRKHDLVALALEILLDLKEKGMPTTLGGHHIAISVLS